MKKVDNSNKYTGARMAHAQNRRHMAQSEILIMRLDAELKQRLQDAAEFEHVSMSEIVRRLIDELPRLGVIKDGLVEWYDNNKE